MANLDKNKTVENLTIQLKWQLDIGAEAMVSNSGYDRKKNYTSLKVKEKEVKESFQTPLFPKIPPKPQKYPDNHINAINVEESILSSKNLKQLRESLEKFEGSNLKKTATNLVFSDGPPNSKIMFIGEAPGSEEDRLGKPFVGLSGDLFNRMLKSIELGRDNVYVANIIPWRPPGNRQPTYEEIQSLLPFLIKQIELVSPSLLVAVGGLAAKTLMNTKGGILRHRGIWSTFDAGLIRDIPIIATLHPNYLLKAPSQKKLAWEDLKMIRQKLKQLKQIN